MTHASNRLISIALLAVPGVTGSTLYGLYDVLNSPGRDWELVMSGRPGPPAFTPVVVATSADPMEGGNGVRLVPQACLDDHPCPDIAIVPEIHVAPNDFQPANYAREYEWLRGVYEAGGIVASVCSGTLLVAASGLLDGKEATTHWAYSDALARMNPSIRVRAERTLIGVGEGERVITCGGGAAWHDLALYLIARYVGAEEAVKIARLYLIDWHREGQSPFAALVCSQSPDDGAIVRAQDWIADHYTDPAPVAGMIAASGLAERSFNRRFVKATGHTPMSYVHTLRLEEAKQMLETEDRPVETIAIEVGYEDPSFFRRLFRRRVGITPGAYRRRFGRRYFTADTAHTTAAPRKDAVIG
ncbi:MAG: GlxA family transcriptional regulator [Dichotomicrobium sp.]